MQGPSNPEPPSAVRGDASIAGARCALHPEVPASAVCARCGNYMCSTCSEQGRSSLCSDCRARPDASNFPFSRTNYTVQGLIDFTWRRWKANWLNLSLAALIFLGVTYGFAAAIGVSSGLMTVLSHPSSDGRSAIGAGGFQFAMQFVEILLQIWLQLGLFALLVDVLQGRQPQLGMLFSRSGKLVSALGQMLLIYLCIIPFAFPFAAVFLAHDNAVRLKIAFGIAALEIVPAVYLALGLAFAMVELSCNPAATALAAMRTSFAMANGQRWSVLGMGLVAVLVTIAGALACCVGAIPAMSLGMMMICSLYLALRLNPGA
jgi:hypothetical protein